MRLHRGSLMDFGVSASEALWLPVQAGSTFVSFPAPTAHIESWGSCAGVFPLWRHLLCPFVFLPRVPASYSEEARPVLACVFWVGAACRGNDSLFIYIQVLALRALRPTDPIRWHNHGFTFRICCTAYLLCPVILMRAETHSCQIIVKSFFFY